jgi:hypothetical protein
MAVLLTDQDIDLLLNEPKPLSETYQARLHLRDKRGHKEREMEVDGANGSRFQVRIRQANAQALDFSVILLYYVPKTNVMFRLRRYNGKSHEHTNKIEGQRFFDFHVHTATERYQKAGWDEDAFATPTDRFSDITQAVHCMLQDCGFQLPAGAQLQLI